MVHARTSKHSYANWALRLVPDTLAITHISTRPVIQSSDYAKLEGYFAGVLIVGSFHVVQAPDGQQVGLLSNGSVSSHCHHAFPLLPSLCSERQLLTGMPVVHASWVEGQQGLCILQACQTSRSVNCTECSVAPWGSFVTCRVVWRHARQWVQLQVKSRFTCAAAKYVMRRCMNTQMLRMLLGEGDQYSAWEELPMAGISWYALEAPVECATEHDVLQFSRRRQARRLQHSGQRRRHLQELPIPNMPFKPGSVV